MTPEMFAGIVGIVFSLIINYVPVAATWYYQLGDGWKRGVMLLAGLVVAVAMFGLSCINWYAITSCDVVGAKSMIQLLVAFLIGNQVAYLLTPESKIKKQLESLDTP